MFLVMMWRNNRKMDAYISTVLEERFAFTRETGRKGRNLMDLALEAYLKDQSSTSKETNTVTIDPQFMKEAICQVKTFLFAGHDTVSGTLCYTWYLLNKNPEKLAKIRDEHNLIFGADPERAVEMIQTSPRILNQLEYTLAVLKETLRLFPAATTVREGDKK
jgi:cytochrome P450